MKSILPILWKPRAIVRYLNQRPRSHLIILAILSVFYFAQISIFILSLEKITFAPLLSWNGLKLVVFSFLTVLVGTFTLIQTVTLTIWVCAKSIGGQGTLPETRNALSWALMWMLPLGLFLLLIYFTIRNPEHGRIALAIRIASYIGSLAALVYMWIVLCATMSEVNRFSLQRAFLSAAFGLALFAAIAFVALKFF